MSELFHGHDQCHSVQFEVAEIEEFVPRREIRTILYVGCCCAYEAGQLQKLYPHAQIHAVEANRESFDAFLRDERCCCPPEVITHCVTISHTDGWAALQKSEMNTQHSLLKSNDWKVVDVDMVETETLQTFCEKRYIVPDMIVLDVEGVAGRVLIGAGPRILSNVKVVMAETEPKHKRPVFEDGDLDEFVDRVLSLYGMTRKVCAPTERQWNSVWVRV